VGKGDAIVKHVGLFFLKNCSLVTSSGETYHCCVIWHYWLVGDISSHGVVLVKASWIKGITS
jgi:hypothetical protein